MGSGNNLPIDYTAEFSEMWAILREWQQLQRKSGPVYQAQECEGETLFQLVLPEVL